MAMVRLDIRHGSRNKVRGFDILRICARPIHNTCTMREYEQRLCASGNGICRIVTEDLRLTHRHIPMIYNMVALEDPTSYFLESRHII